MATFGERLKQLREEKNLSQQELGDEIGVSKDTVYRWEASKMQPKEEHVSLLSRIFNVSYLYLLGDVDDRFMIITDEASEEIDEQRILELYRKLSPEFKKMILLTIDSAYLADKEAKEKRLRESN